MSRVHRDACGGFTLIELSIVLVIIGLIVGGVLVGQDLIRAAAVRATISQIEKYQTAVNTFREKYDALPGDMNAATAAQFGFAPRGQYAGEGDGNGIIQGISADAPNSACDTCFITGETAMFWVDLSKAGLIDGAFNTATSTSDPATLNFGNYLPQVKTGHNGYFNVWSGGWSTHYLNPSGVSASDGRNYFSLINFDPASGPIASLTVSEAYAIDKKMDDGLPQGGSVTAMDTGSWASGGPNGEIGDYDVNTGGGPVYAGDGVATAPSATTCYDNSSVAGATEKYSLATNNGAGLNCSLSFQFQ